MKYLGIIVILAVISFTSSQFTFTTQPIKKLSSPFNPTRLNFGLGQYQNQNRYQTTSNNYGQYNSRDSDDYTPQYNGRYRSRVSNSRYQSQNDGRYSSGEGKYKPEYDNSGQYIPDDSGRYTHVDSKYEHLDVAGLGYKHQGGDIEKYRPDYSSDGYNGDFEKYKGDGGYKGSPDDFDVGGYKGDSDKYRGDGGYKDNFDSDKYRGDRDKQVPYVDNNDSGASGNGKKSGGGNKGTGIGKSGFNSGLNGNSNPLDKVNPSSLLQIGNKFSGRDDSKLSGLGGRKPSGRGFESANNNNNNNGGSRNNNNNGGRSNNNNNNNNNKFINVNNARKGLGSGDDGLLNNRGNANARRDPSSQRVTDKCIYNGSKNYKIIRQLSDLGIEQDHYYYETENCMYKEETGVHVNIDNKKSLKAEGLYYYVAPDNVKYTTTYTADERGYIPSGDHIPETPPLILKGLQYLKSIGKL